LPLTQKTACADSDTEVHAVTLSHESAPFGALMARALIDIGSLDLRVQEQVAKHGSFKDFQLTLWRQDPDATGCNWNARIEPISGRAAPDTSWRAVVPSLRERYNLN
jgi:hypothetical protein